jgi:hypothetical protein
MRQRRIRGYLGSGPNDRERWSARLFVRAIPFSDVAPGLSPFLTRSNPVPPGSNYSDIQKDLSAAGTKPSHDRGLPCPVDE